MEFSFSMGRIDADQSFTHGMERTPNPDHSKNLKGLESEKPNQSLGVDVPESHDPIVGVSQLKKCEWVGHAPLCRLV
jgi:hypothetical protein